MEKIAIIGHFGGNEAFFDGQTVKTKNLAQLLCGERDLSVKRVDTYYARGKKIKLLWQTVWALLTCKHIFLLVSVNGLRVFLPLLYALNTITRRPIYHYVIGSELLGMVKEDPKLVKYLNSFAANWFEYESGTQALRKMGVTNVDTVPNFKAIAPVAEAHAYCAEDRHYRFCTFSRVMREKGITEAIEVIARIKKESGEIAVSLDIYGPIDPTYREELDALLSLHADCVTYRGIVESDRSVEALKDYYALLFPTTWPGEGLPGTVIDAFAAGLPVIASDWNANKEIIRHGVQGIVYPFDDVQTLYDAIVWALAHTDAFNEMRVACRAQFAAYMPETVLTTIRTAMRKDGKAKGNDKD